MNIANEGAAPKAKAFWGEIAPCEHLVQIYQDDRSFLDALTGFVAGGICAGDSVIVIGTPPHVRSLEDRLRTQGIDLDAARSFRQYVALDAEEVLARFMVNDWPDEDRFEAVVTDLLNRVSRGRVRAFGEMVALLWARGHAAATVRLEHLWHRLCQQKAFSLFCAYPQIGFTQDPDSSIKEICAAHSKTLCA